MNKIILKTDQKHPQIVAYKQALEKGLKSHHVLPRGNEWIVKKANTQKASGVYSTQSEAIQNGKIFAKNSGSELFIHGQDGRIRE
jgi:hypothetical protein